MAVASDHDVSTTARVALTIDGRAVTTWPGATVLEAALASGIDLPRLCHHPELSAWGGCRLCLVEVEGQSVPQPGCGLAAQEGMKVTTRSELLTGLRREVLDLLLSDHPLNCVICEKAGRCDLQRYAYEFGLAETTHEKEISRTLYQDDNAFFLRDHQYCISCTRCVRVCDEVVGAAAIEMAERGFGTYVATPFDAPLHETSCTFCGSCVQVCPTAALMPVSRAGRGREWELTRTRTVCPYCGTGCGLEVATSHGEIVSVMGYPEAPANGEFLCAKGRFGLGFVTHPQRLRKPMVRRDLAHRLGLTPDPAPASIDRSPLARASELADTHLEVEWSEALDIVAGALADVITDSGPDAVAGIGSALAANEDNYALQKLLRGVVGTNNVDLCARLCHAPSVAGLAAAFGSGAMTNAIHEIRSADCVLIIGSNTGEAHPVVSYEVVRAVRSGASLVIIDPRWITLTPHATLHLRPAPGTDHALYLGMLNAIVNNAWQDASFIAERTEEYETMAAALGDWTPEAASAACGVPAEQIVEAARLYALGLRRTGARTLALNRDGDSRGASTIIYGMGITERSNGTELVKTLANLAMVTGQIGRPSTGVNPLRGQSNVQGGCDMGSLPNVYPGYQRVDDPAVREKFARAWGERRSPAGRKLELPDRPGLTMIEMLRAAADGRVRAMYVMGMDLIMTCPDSGLVERALRALDLLVVQEIVPTPTAKLAHVVLPALSFAEKSGTFVNTERRFQLLRPFLPPPGEARPDWEIIAKVGRRLGRRLRRPVRWTASSAAEVMDEIAGLCPIFAGISHARLEAAGLQWPCPSPDHPGTPFLHGEQFTRGKGRFHATTPLPPFEPTDEQYPMALSTGRILYHYNCGSMTLRAAPLEWRESRPYVQVNRRDAEDLGIEDGRPCLVTSRRASVRVQARVGEVVPPGMLYMPFHFRAGAANLLTHSDQLDAGAKTPEFKFSAVRLEPVRAAKGGPGRDQASGNGREPGGEGAPSGDQAV